MNISPIIAVFFFAAICAASCRCVRAGEMLIIFCARTHRKEPALEHHCSQLP